MKTLKKFSLTLFALLLVFSYGSAIAGGLYGNKKAGQQSYITIRGKVVDSETGVPLVFATVGVSETNVAVVTNIDGEFTIKLGESLTSKNLEFTFLGYKTKSVPVSSMRDNGYKNVVRMESAPIPIKEIIVKPLDPTDIVLKAITRIGKNYETVPNLMTAFYRETIRKNRTYVSIGEAAVEIFKAPYANDLRFDNARIYKGRKSTDVQKMDTVLFKLEGGPLSSLELDLAKNTESILTVDAMKYYDYSLSGVIEIDGRAHYVISFKQKPSVEMPLFMGDLYIDADTYAISQAEFGFNLADKAAVSSIFIKKKPLGMEVTPELATYMVKYREQSGKWHFEYSRAEVKFKVNWKKKLFNTYYTTMSEIAVTDRTDQEVIKFASKDRLKYTDIFSDKVSAFADPNFWGDYNVIEPDQSIDAAIRRLSRKLKFSDRQDLEK
ncbi:MAG: carboxypeptidase-like regulatory domain-containing protein [Bacteroidales bacterium]